MAIIGRQARDVQRRHSPGDGGSGPPAGRGRWRSRTRGWLAVRASVFDNRHVIPLEQLPDLDRPLDDEVIETMRQTGSDMQTKYKETSLGGLAVNVAEC